MFSQSMSIELIAPCGMNCALCMAHLRDKKHCPGCNASNESLPKSCVKCIIKNCEIIKNSQSKLCYECDKFPCKRLKQMDKRYRSKYHMSEIENLEFIKLKGMDAFLASEKTRWTCSQCGKGVINVHRGVCSECKAIIWI